MEDSSNETRLQSALNPEGVNPMTRQRKPGNKPIERQAPANQSKTARNRNLLAVKALTKFRQPGLTRKKKSKSSNVSNNASKKFEKELQALRVEKSQLTEYGTDLRDIYNESDVNESLNIEEQKQKLNKLDEEYSSQTKTIKDAYQALQVKLDSLNKTVQDKYRTQIKNDLASVATSNSAFDLTKKQYMGALDSLQGRRNSSKELDNAFKNIVPEVISKNLKDLFTSGDADLKYPKLNFQEAKTPFEQILIKLKAKTNQDTNEAKAYAELYAKLFVYMYLIYQFQQKDQTSLGDFLDLFKFSQEEVDFKTIFTDETISKLETAIERLKDIEPMIEEAYFRIKPKTPENPNYTEQLLNSKAFLEKLPRLREVL
jgi:DNA-binding HxlR family transcriptional regulator